MFAFITQIRNVRRATITQCYGYPESLLGLYNIDIGKQTQKTRIRSAALFLLNCTSFPPQPVFVTMQQFDEEVASQAIPAVAAR